MFSLIKKYLSLIDDIVVDFLTDIKSLRYQLVLAAFAFNVYLFKNGADKTVLIASVGLLSAVYAMYFYSKHKQAQLEAVSEPTVVNGDPDTSLRDPDNI